MSNTEINLRILQPNKASHISFSCVFHYDSEKDCIETLIRALPFLMKGSLTMEHNEIDGIHFKDVPIQASKLRTDRYEKTGN